MNSGGQASRAHTFLLSHLHGPVEAFALVYGAQYLVFVSGASLGPIPCLKECISSFI